MHTLRGIRMHNSSIRNTKSHTSDRAGTDISGEHNIRHVNTKHITYTSKQLD